MVPTMLRNLGRTPIGKALLSANEHGHAHHTITEEAEPLYVPRARTLIPRNYQVADIKFLQATKRAGLFLAPGLGKTLISSEAAQGNGPVLVACPSYLVWQWCAFLEDQYPEATVLVPEGTRAQRNSHLAQYTDAQGNSAVDWIIVNKEMLRDYSEVSDAGTALGYPIPKCKTLILDESHHFRGRGSQQTKGAYKYGRDCEYVFLLTGSPMMKSIDDMFAQLRIIAPKDFTSYHRFVQNHTYYIDTAYNRQVVKARNPYQFRALLNRYSVTRSYQDVGLELPTLVEKTIPVLGNAAFWKTYKAIKDNYTFDDRDVNSMMEAMHLMRKLEHQPKLEAALELMQDIPTTDGVAWFTWYKDVADALGTILKCPVIHGDTPPRERKEIAQRTRTVAATMASLSEGVDLSHYDHVIFFEMDYVPGVMYQALSRVRRWSPLGSNKIVTVYYLYVKDALGHIIHNAAKARTGSIRSVMREALT